MRDWKVQLQEAVLSIILAMILLIIAFGLFLIGFAAAIVILCSGNYKLAITFLNKSFVKLIGGIMSAALVLCFGIDYR
jgi:hypothetical protein